VVRCGAREREKREEMVGGSKRQWTSVVKFTLVPLGYS
jgi:hypothetical protein